MLCKHGVCMCGVCAHVCACACEFMWVGQKGMLNALLYPFPPYSFGTESLPKRGVELTVRKALQASCLHLPQHQGCRCMCGPEFWDLNVGFCVCVPIANTLRLSAPNPWNTVSNKTYYCKTHYKPYTNIQFYLYHWPLTHKWHLNSDIINSSCWYPFIFSRIFV